MEIIFTYLPVRLKDVTEIYLKYSIGNLNTQNIIPTIYSDKDYFTHTDLKYKWIQFDVDSKYKVDNLWSYPKLKVLSIINKPFIHLDNDLVVEDFNKFINLIKLPFLNICYKRKVEEAQRSSFIDIFKKYSNKKLNFEYLNNTSIIGADDYELVNKSYKEVLNVIDTHYDFFLSRYNTIPPITLNQQYPNLYFNNINYLFDENPSFENLSKNGICHLSEKNMIGNFVKNKNLI
jgi:hypothetical protein